MTWAAGLEVWGFPQGRSKGLPCTKSMDFDHTHEWDEIDEMYRVGPNPSRSVEPKPREKSWGGAETGSVIESSGLHLSQRAPTGA